MYIYINMPNFVEPKYIYAMTKSKKQRLDVLRDIISTQKITCQSDLLKPLQDAGIDVTQATLSRDLKQLKIAKVPDSSGKYAYALPPIEMHKRMSQSDVRSNRHPQVGLGGFISIQFSANIAVIKTSPGFAGSIAYDIDSGNSNDILGTVAGDDTIFVVLREGIAHDEACDILSQFIPALRQY